MVENLFSVQDKVVLITGGSKGIGKMIAEVFVRCGAKVYITARHGDVCAATAQELSEFGTCIAIENDLSSMAGIEALVVEMTSREARLDVLINNAATGWHEDYERFPETGWDKTMHLNLKAVFFLTQGLTPLLEKSAAADNPAKVINIASVDGIGIAYDDSYPYTASKAGVIHMTRSLSKVLAAKDIHINAVIPGAFASDMNIAARDTPERLAKFVPGKRVGAKEDIGGTCVYLASRAGNYTIGAGITVDGGWTAIAYGGLVGP